MSPDFNYAHIHIKAIKAAKRTGKVNLDQIPDKKLWFWSLSQFVYKTYVMCT